MAAIFEEFANGDDFNASDFNTYSMRQSIIACDNATDRDAIATPQEGLTVYRKDLDIMQQYLGAVWRDIDYEKSDHVAAYESTTSTSYVDLTTVGPTVSINVPASGKVLVTTATQIANGTAGQRSYMGVALSGANIRAAADAQGSTAFFRAADNGFEYAVAVELITGLTPGVTQFQAKYKAQGSTAVFQLRNLVVKAVA